MKSFDHASDKKAICNRIAELRGSRNLWGRYLFLIGFLILVFSFTVYSLIQYSGKTMRQNLMASMQQDIGQRKNNLELRLSNLYRGAESLMSLVYPYMNLEGERAEQLTEYEKLNSFIRIYLNNGIASNIRLYVPLEKLYSTQGQTFRSLEMLQNSPNHAEMEFLKKSGLFWQETQEVANTGLFHETIQAISCVYSIRKKTDYDSMACVLFLDIDVSLLNTILDPDDEPEKKVYLVNQSGACLANPDQSLIGETTINSEAMTRIQQETSGTLEQNGMLYVFEKLDSTKWYVVMVLPEASVETGQIRNGPFVPIMLAGILLIFALTCLSLAHNLVINALSRYLRQSISKETNIIPLEEELELSKTYLLIMLKRFENRFTMRFEIEDGAEACLIPKFSLQPLLENALLHGILYCSKENCEVCIRAWTEDDTVLIEIEDNGNGMSEEKQKALEHDSGYGLSNVRKRLLIFGKGSSDFSISSREGLGTCITICIPAIYKDEA